MFLKKLIKKLNMFYKKFILLKMSCLIQCVTWHFFIIICEFTTNFRVNFFSTPFFFFSELKKSVQDIL